MERTLSSKRKRESPDEDEVGERKAAQDDAKGVVNQVRFPQDFQCHCAYSRVIQEGCSNRDFSGLRRIHRSPFI